MLRRVLEIRTEADALLGTPLATGLRGAGEQAGGVRWMARLRDDDGRVWRAEAGAAAALGTAWTCGDAPPPCAALRSLRPAEIEVRAQLPDGRSASRTVRRRLLADGVEVRRWRDRAPLAVTLYLPAERPATGVVLLDQHAGEPVPWLPVAAALLASRGPLVATATTAGAGRRAGQADAIADLAAALQALPQAGGAAAAVLTEVPLPPGLPAPAGTDAAQG